MRNTQHCRIKRRTHKHTFIASGATCTFDYRALVEKARETGSSRSLDSIRLSPNNISISRSPPSLPSAPGQTNSLGSRETPYRSQPPQHSRKRNADPLRRRSMAAPIREVDFSGCNRAFIKHTLLYYINDIDSEKHNQLRTLFLRRAAHHPTLRSSLRPRVPYTCVYTCVCVSYFTNAHT